MTLPLITMDIVLFAVLVIALLAAGAIIGRKTAPSKTPEFRKLLTVMSRADHVLDSYILVIKSTAKKISHREWPVEDVAIIAQTADQMERHVHRLRQIRRGLDPARTRVGPENMAKLIDDIQVALAPSAADRGIRLGRVEIHGTNRPVTADSDMLKEIFTTLLDNAIKHNPPGTEVVAELTQRNGKALVRISDNGKGIKAELLPVIFDEGEKDDSAGSAPGSGMGLFIARNLTEINGGTISVESQVGSGSTFSVELPYEFYRANELNEGWMKRALAQARLLHKRIPSLSGIR